MRERNTFKLCVFQNNNNFNREAAINSISIITIFGTPSNKLSYEYVEKRNIVTTNYLNCRFTHILIVYCFH